jgi:hypothetical protein
MPAHGEFDARRGWYSAVTNAWHNQPGKIGQLVQSDVDPEGKRAEWERMNRPANAFEPNPQMERLIQLRDSGRSEERSQFDKLAAGGLRMSLAAYEKDRARHS